MLDTKDDFDQQRQMYSVLVLHFIEGVKQSEIAERLNLSHTCLLYTSPSPRD